jgi:hypothetical protein
MTKTNSPQDRKEPRAKKSCVGQKLKFLKKGVAQAQAARASGYMHTSLFFPQASRESDQKSWQESHAWYQKLQESCRKLQKSCQKSPARCQKLQESCRKVARKSQASVS